jgi:hypothetical protein
MEASTNENERCKERGSTIRIALLHVFTEIQNLPINICDVPGRISMLLMRYCPVAAIDLPELKDNYSKAYHHCHYLFTNVTLALQS